MKLILEKKQAIFVVIGILFISVLFMPNSFIFKSSTNNESLNFRFGQGTIVNAESQYNVKIMAYIQSGIVGVDKSSYEKFIEDINTYFNSNNINVNFIIEKIEWFDKDEDCGSKFNDADVIMCVGSGKGGYLGPPYFISNANTDSPYGFSETGVHCESHELIHFLGFEDLYWLITEPISSPLTDEIKNNLMFDPNVDNPIIDKNVKYVINVNLDKLNKGDHNSIIYPKDRMPKKFIIHTSSPNEQCDIYVRERVYAESKSKLIMENPAISIKSDENGVFEMDLIAGVPIDNNFDVYYIKCDSDVYWINVLIAEDCYKEGDEKCNIACSKDKDWCERIEAETETTPESSDSQLTEEIIIEITADYYYSIEQDLDFVVLGQDRH